VSLVGHALHLDWRGLARLVQETVGEVDAVITDAPYDARTHLGHDKGHADFDQETRRSISYAPWEPKDVRAFVKAWSPLCRGWMVSITSDGLAGAWRAAMEAAGRVSFAPIPAIEKGATDRKHNDGPASWTTWVVVGRPRGGRWIGWGSPSPYYLGPREQKPTIGGKPLWLMRSIVADYSRPEDLVADPCCGSGTTLLAAQLLGRRWIGSDVDAESAELARERTRTLPTAPRRGTLALPWPEEP
jgi:site-specific DNA-methyltransferase (adenine-specific)